MKYIIVLNTFALICFLIISCNLASDSQNNNSGDNTGLLSITINKGMSRTIAPIVSAKPASYQIEGTGPAGASYSDNITNNSSQIEIAIGEWTVEVTAFDETGSAIGTGSANTFVASDGITTVDITTFPVSGSGTLDLKVVWDDIPITNPVIEATLTLDVGTEQTLTFSITGNQAVYNENNIPTGYHSLTIKLFDDDDFIAGAAEVVNIVKDTKSTASFILNPLTNTFNVGVITGSFRTLWRVDENELTIPLRQDGTYDFEINWGDGTSEQISESPNRFIQHSYVENGEYEVSITGTCEGFGAYYDFKYDDKKGELLDILEWGNVKLHNYGWQFTDYSELVKFSAIDEPDLSNITRMTSMLRNCHSFNHDISSWDISNVTSMDDMFSSCHAFNQDISGWDTSNVTDMELTFYQCTSFNQDISGWNTSNVEFMQSMFLGCTSFNQDISGWETSNVRIFSNMFHYCQSFNQDLSSWDTSSAINISDMFKGAASFNCGNIDISTWEWNVDNVLYKDDTFKGTLLEGSEPDWYKSL